jgi:NAD(P)H-dependent flavin oxidoreductase YrpB (nitropropane dioxygenase family)
LLTADPADRLARFRDRLSLPLIAAPMFLVSGIELVTAACRNGVIGAFPTVNCRSPEELDRWLADASLDPDDLPARGAIGIGKDIDVGAREARPKRWRDIWSAGHSTSGVTDVPAVAELIARTQEEYRAADAQITRANSVNPRCWT